MLHLFCHLLEVCLNKIAREFVSELFCFKFGVFYECNQSKNSQSSQIEIEKELPSQISNVISSYEDFAGQPVPDDAKGFTAHHNACKSAVVHAETLLKLARWTADDASSESSPSADWEKFCLRPDRRPTVMKMTNIDFSNLYISGCICRVGVPAHQRKIARWLSRLWTSPVGRRGLLMAFRNSGKSTLVGLFCAWVLYRSPETRILVMAADYALAKKWCAMLNGLSNAIL